MCLKSLRKDCAAIISPGVDISTFWVYASEIETMPAILTTNTAGDKVTYDGNIVLKEDALWRELTLHVKKGEVENEKIGENSIGGWVNKAIGSIAGNSSAAAEFAACSTTTCGVVILYRQNDGNVRVIGKKEAPAIVSEWKENTGKMATDFAGHTFIFSADNDKPAYYYPGIIAPISIADFSDDFGNDFLI